MQFGDGFRAVIQPHEERCSMNIGIFKSETPYTTGRRAVKDGFADLDAAIAWARENFQVAFLDIDEDCENCADFITKGGDIYAVEHV
jgi:hypothetical protein